MGMITINICKQEDIDDIGFLSNIDKLILRVIILVAKKIRPCFLHDLTIN